MEDDPLNTPRWPEARGAFAEVWFVVGSDPRTGQGVWLRYTADTDQAGKRSFAIWGAWFEEGRTFAIRNFVPQFAGAPLGATGCAGEVEGGGHSLRWRLQFGAGPKGGDFFPAWLRPIARLRGSGYLQPHPATTLSGAVEVDGRLVELQRMPAAQAHLFNRTSMPEWAWAHCGAFAEDPDASLELFDGKLRDGVRVPVFVFRFRGATHEFGDLPWIALTRSSPAAPSWHFSAQDATLAIDGVVHAAPSQMVQVHYAQTDGSSHHCINTELAAVELRVRTRAFPGAPWRPEATLTAKSAASLEFRGREPDPRVSTLLVTAAQQKQADSAGSVAS